MILIVIFLQGRSVRAWLLNLALHWQSLNSTDDHLTDYGEAHNLLECVPTYIHKVAAFNAANVWMMRQMALVLSAEGNVTGARWFNASAGMTASISNLDWSMPRQCLGKTNELL